MEESTKRAYRLLLAHMLQIYTLTHSTGKGENLQRSSPLSWWWHLPEFLRCRDVSILLRDLAFASAHGFEEFEERTFWQEFARLEQRHPHAGLAPVPPIVRGLGGPRA